MELIIFKASSPLFVSVRSLGLSGKNSSHSPEMKPGTLPKAMYSLHEWVGKREFVVTLKGMTNQATAEIVVKIN